MQPGGERDVRTSQVILQVNLLAMRLRPQYQAHLEVIQWLLLAGEACAMMHQCNAAAVLALA